VSERTGPGSFERSDADARPIFLAGFLLALIVAASMAASAWITQETTEEFEQGEPDPVSALRTRPDGPELQAIPARELAAHRAWEERMLEGTAWVDPINRVVRIPVERAAELVLQEGFPVRAEGGK